MKRVRFEKGAITVAGKGSSPKDCSPLAFIVGDLAYEATVTLDLLTKGEGGLLLFYSEHGFAGIGFTSTEMRTFIYAEEQTWMRTPTKSDTITVRVKNDRNIVTWSYSHDGGATWTQHAWQMEVSGLHHNVFGGFLSLKPAIYSAGGGSIRVRDCRYRALSS
jgi:xylan 1,4-beta-xylosidase